MSKTISNKLIAAVFTPFTSRNTLNLDAIEPYAEFLAANGVAGVFVGGTTGEGLSLTTAERFKLARQWVKVCAGKLEVFIHVGHQSQAEACALAVQAQSIGANDVATIGPVFFKPRTLEGLVDYCARIAAAAPDLPFYYYHIPVLTGLRYPMIKFLEIAQGCIPTLAGIKYTDEDLMDFGLCSQFKRGRFNLVFGRDEILLSALVLGARHAIGSTYNFYSPGYRRIITAFNKGDLTTAREEQLQVMKLVQIYSRFGGIPAGKAIMKFLGIDCGPVRPPLGNLSPDENRELRRELEASNFFNKCVR